jgi:hypothetical protein
MNHVETLSRILVSDDPRRSADKILGFLVALTDARAGAVLSIEAGEPVLFVIRNLGLDALAGLRPVWLQQRAALAAGRSITDRGRSLIPLLSGPELVGILYLEAPRTLDPDTIALYTVSLVQALRAEAKSPPAEIGAMRADDLQRLQLLKALDENEWNIARVARILGITRRTVNLRLERFGIKRRRVPKTLRTRPKLRESMA